MFTLNFYRWWGLLICLVLSSTTGTFAAPLISEFMADNNSAIYDEDGDSSDWIELFNPGPNTVDLGGYFLTSDPAERTEWEIPAPTVLPSGGSLIVFASSKDRNVGELHTNFRLGKDDQQIQVPNKKCDYIGRATSKERM